MWLFGWLAIWLTGCLPAWLAGGLVVQLAGELAGWLSGWLALWLAIWLLGIWLANRLEPRIGRDQQFKTTNVKIHPAVLKVNTHLISFGQMEMANASENFGNTLVGLRPWNGAIHDFRRNVQNVFSVIWTNAVRLRRSEKILVIWLAGYLAGWLAI